MNAVEKHLECFHLPPWAKEAFNFKDVYKDFEKVIDTTLAEETKLHIYLACYRKGIVLFHHLQYVHRETMYNRNGYGYITIDGMINAINIPNKIINEIENFEANNNDDKYTDFRKRVKILIDYRRHYKEYKAIKYDLVERLLNKTANFSLLKPEEFLFLLGDDNCQLSEFDIFNALIFEGTAFEFIKQHRIKDWLKMFCANTINNGGKYRELAEMFVKDYDDSI